MKQLFYSSLTAIAVLFVFNANSQIYIKATGAGNFTGQLPGDVTVVGFEDQIEALAYSSAIAGCNTQATTASAACKPSLGSLAFTMMINRSVIPLKYFATSGVLLPTVDISFRKTGGDGNPLSYYKIRMENVMVSSISEGGSGTEVPTFSVELTPQKIAWAYYQQKADGTTNLVSSYGWDVKNGTQWNYVF